MSEKEKRERRDFIFELLEKEWDRRMNIIHDTKKIETEDVVTISVLTLNREMGECVKEIEIVQKNMVTKGDLRWALGIGFTFVTIVISLVTLLL